MLSYLILTTRAVLLAAIICGAAAGYTHLACGRNERILVRILAAAGIAAAGIIAIFRNATSKVDSSILNGWLYGIALAAFVLFLILTLTPFAKRAGKGVSIAAAAVLGAELFAVLAYTLPDVWGYPYHILLSEKTALSTDFLLGIIGMILALVLALVLFLAAARSSMRLTLRGSLTFLIFLLAIHSVLRLSGLISVFFQKKIIKSNHLLFTYTVFVKNHTDIFLFIALAAVIVLAFLLFARAAAQKEPYHNPAEHRKILARWRSVRRWAGTALACAVFSVLVLTVIDKASQQEVVLSPIEDASKEDDENIYIDFSKVEDGHLHRFAYETEQGTVIRFIVIKKPNSSSYGIGLDACDVCGETGYYEKQGQVVCNRCDVVMNISTIGFKGGCNPIVIPYQIENGQIIVPISGLLEYESEFK